MVNENSTRERLYDELYGAAGVVSGETLSRTLNISRVAVWKHIQAMIRDGVTIHASAGGYRLDPDPDLLLPLACSPYRDRVHYLAETGSTMDEAAALARRGCPHFTVVVAGRQSAGRGRMQRVWSSGDGGLYCTVVLRPALDPAAGGLLTLAAAVDLAALLAHDVGIPARLKWPNDILVDGAKICGLLSQMEMEGGRIAHLNVGIGLNVNNRPESEQPGAVSVRALTGRPVGRREILLGFLARFESRLESFDGAAVLDEWKAANITIGRRVRLRTIKKTMTGTAVDIDAHGGLVLELDDGARVTALHGDCFHD